MSTFDEYIPGRFTQPLAAARAEHARGRRIVGYLGDDVPVELILAANALPLRLDVVPGATLLADRYLESSFGPMYRSYLEQWLRGDFDFIETIVFPRSNDSAQRLYYYVCELQRRGVCKGPTPLIFDMARIARATSRAHTSAAADSLASALKTDRFALAAAAKRIGDRVGIARRLGSLRTGSIALAGSDVMQAWRALQLDWTASFERTVLEWSSVAQRRQFSRRIVLAGSTPPDERIHRAVEAGDGNVVDEFFDGSMSQSIARWTSDAASVDAIADAYRDARSTDNCWLHQPDALVERVRERVAHAVILWLVEEDEGIVWEVPHQIERLRRAGIAVLGLTRQRWDADADVLARITKFARLGTDL